MWLIGMMGSGKTSVGRLVADRAGVPFHDIDLIVEGMAGTDIATLWREQGEDVFRRLEAEAVRTVPHDGVIAGGGGVVVTPENRQRIMADGPVIWLRADPDTILARTGQDGTRPLLDQPEPISTLHALAEQRQPFFVEVASHTIDTDDRTISEVAQEVMSLWRP